MKEHYTWSIEASQMTGEKSKYCRTLTIICTAHTYHIWNESSQNRRFAMPLGVWSMDFGAYSNSIYLYFRLKYHIEYSRIVQTYRVFEFNSFQLKKNRSKTPKTMMELFSRHSDGFHSFARLLVRSFVCSFIYSFLVDSWLKLRSHFHHALNIYVWVWYV